MLKMFIFWKAVDSVEMKCLVKNHSNVERNWTSFTGQRCQYHSQSNALGAQCGYCQAGFEVELLGCWAGLSCSSTEAKQTAPRWEVTQQRGHNPPCEALFENVQKHPQALSCVEPAWSSLGALVHLASLEVPCPTSPPGEMPAPALNVSWSGISDTAPTSKKGTADVLLLRRAF